MYQVVRYISECDTVPVNNPSTREECLWVMRQQIHEIGKLDLINTETGRFASWAI